MDLFSAHRGTATAIKAKQQEIIMVGSEVTTDAARQLDMTLKVMERSKENTPYRTVVAKAWRDPAFKSKLLLDANAALTEALGAVPTGVTVRVVENSDEIGYFVLPLQPTGELTEENITGAAGFYLDKPGGDHEFMTSCIWCEFCISVVTKAWSDPIFKTMLLTDPRAALIAAGGVLREGEVVKVVENTGKLVHLILPAGPPGELSEEALEEIVAGTAACWIASPHLPTLEKILRRE
jgi:Nitrile hydratase, alpha chain